MTTPGATSTGAIVSIGISTLTTGFASAMMSFDKDVDVICRKRSPTFYGFIPDDHGLRGRCARCFKKKFEKNNSLSVRERNYKKVHTHHQLKCLGCVKLHNAVQQVTASRIKVKLSHFRTCSFLSLHTNNQQQHILLFIGSPFVVYAPPRLETLNQ